MKNMVLNRTELEEGRSKTIRGWQTIRSALQNLKIVRKSYSAGEGKKHVINFEKVKEKAEQFGITEEKEEREKYRILEESDNLNTAVLKFFSSKGKFTKEEWINAFVERGKTKQFALQLLENNILLEYIYEEPEGYYNVNREKI